MYLINLIHFLLMAIFITPMVYMFQKSQGNPLSNEAKDFEVLELYLYQAIKRHENIDGLKVFHHGYNGGLIAYKYPGRAGLGPGTGPAAPADPARLAGHYRWQLRNICVCGA